MKEFNGGRIVIAVHCKPNNLLNRIPVTVAISISLNFERNRIVLSILQQGKVNNVNECVTNTLAVGHHKLCFIIGKY